MNFAPLITEIKWYPPKSTFLEDHISAPKRCYTPKFSQALENDQVLLAHPHREQGSPLQFFSKGVQNWLKFQQVHAYNFGGSGSTPTILCHMMALRWA